MQDEKFVDAVYTRYFELRESILSNQFINHYIDSVASFVEEAQARHYKRWDILGRDVGAPEHSPVPVTYAGEIERLKEWIDKRLTWLDANMPGSLITSDRGIRSNASEKILLRLFPNPATDYIYIESDRPISRVSIFNTSGLVEKSHNNKDGFACYINISSLQEGLYFIRVTFEDKTMQTMKFIINQE